MFAGCWLSRASSALLLIHRRHSVASGRPPGPKHSRFTPVVWLAVIYLALVMTALGYSIWYQLLGKYPVNQVMPFLLLLPVTTVMGGVILLGEELTPQIAVGGILAITGVAIINLIPNRAVR